MESTQYLEAMIQDLVDKDSSKDCENSWNSFLDKIHLAPPSFHAYMCDFLRRQSVILKYEYTKSLDKMVLWPHFVNRWTTQTGKHTGGYYLSKLISGSGVPILNRKISIRETRNDGLLSKRLKRLLQLDTLYKFRIRDIPRERIHKILDWWLPIYVPNYLENIEKEEILWAKKAEVEFGI